MFDNYWRLVTHSIYTFSKTPVCDMPPGLAVSLSRLADELCLVSVDHGNFSTCLAFGETNTQLIITAHQLRHCVCLVI